MKIYRVDVRIDDQTPPTPRLVQAKSLAKARDHIMRILSVKAATPDDIAYLAVGENAIEIEVAGDE